MKSTMTRIARTAALGLMLGAAATVLAAPPPAAPNHEMREKMAQIHEQMAACLRSDRSFEDCRSEMRKSCRASLGYGGCRMMQGRMPMGGRRMMGPPPAPPAPPADSPPPP
ncbi:MAG: hypothetical protein KGL34_02280 [Gammaproteobacteria bacterium]|nr:hypothetical protein [Gammaproteobacteria bacterium]